MANPGRGFAGLICLLVLTTALLVHPAAARSEEAVRPVLAEEIERSFDGFFIFTTAGSGQYGVYQLVSGGRGVGDAADVVCMEERCYLPFATAAEIQLAGVAAMVGHRGRLRQSFQAARTAYRDMQRSSAGELASTAAAWRAALQRIGRCLQDIDACPGRT
jgi:hypothetical protein